MMAWICRFVNNALRHTCKSMGQLTAEEIDEAEKRVFHIVQQESLSDENDEKIKNLNQFLDEDGIIRLKTQISNGNDNTNFRFSIVLPPKHREVENMILTTHKSASHVGVQGMLCMLREKY